VRDGFSEFVMQLSEKYAIFAPNKNKRIVEIKIENK
jgi:hypothetical protein